jgi:2-hydroxy-3-keto-5-methylthiopentenyl-1-phosphate phosphatase
LTGLVSSAQSPFHNRETGIDKVAVVQDALRRHAPVAFAGDGPPDLAPARLVRADHRFARGHLAGALVAAGEAYRPLVDWASLAATLLEGTA